MAKEDVIGITVNGENVANFSIPAIGHKVKLDEYQFTHVGGIHEVSVALVEDNCGYVAKSEITVEILPVVTPEPPTDSPAEIVPLAVPPKKTRKPREPKVEAPVVVTPDVPTIVVEETRASEEPSVEPSPVSGDVDSARLPYLKKMIGFYIKAKNLKPGDITIELLKKDALDIVEKDSDVTIQFAIDSLK